MVNCVLSSRTEQSRAGQADRLPGAGPPQRFDTFWPFTGYGNKRREAERRRASRCGDWVRLWTERGTTWMCVGKSGVRGSNRGLEGRRTMSDHVRERDSMTVTVVFCIRRSVRFLHPAHRTVAPRVLDFLDV